MKISLQLKMQIFFMKIEKEILFINKILNYDIFITLKKIKFFNWSG